MAAMRYYGGIRRQSPMIATWVGGPLKCLGAILFVVSFQASSSEPHGLLDSLTVEAAISLKIGRGYNGISGNHRVNDSPRTHRF